MYKMPDRSGSALDLCTVMRHLGVLEKANLIIVKRSGRYRWKHIDPLPSMISRKEADHGAGFSAERLAAAASAPVRPWPIVRDQEKVLATIEQLAGQERVLGDYGGQLTSFEWVFSPRGADGRPLQMFNRETGEVDPAIVAYWHDHYDLAHTVVTDWPSRGPYLKGKIHLTVGTADTFYLDGAAHKFQAVLEKLNADPHFTYIENRMHFDLYKEGDDRQALFDKIAAEMYAVALPGQKWKSE
jgi:DNA-binding transcriptional ArsR family regulator